MKSVLVLFLFALLSAPATVSAQAIEYKVLTIIESIVPGGLGRSRIVEATESLNASDYAKPRVDGKSQAGDVKRKEIKIDEFEETKILNFYSLVGINFRNVASNDAMASAKLTQLAAEGWELAFVTSGVESNAGADDGEGIFITRYIFKRSM